MLCIGSRRGTVHVFIPMRRYDVDLYWEHGRKLMCWMVLFKRNWNQTRLIFIGDSCTAVCMISKFDHLVFKYSLSVKQKQCFLQVRTKTLDVIFQKIWQNSSRHFAYWNGFVPCLQWMKALRNAAQNNFLWGIIVHVVTLFFTRNTTKIFWSAMQYVWRSLGTIPNESLKQLARRCFTK